MAFTGLNLKVARATYKNVSKDIDKLNAALDNFSKYVSELNERIWYGGNAANTWYASANKAYRLDCNFRDKLMRVQDKLATKIEKTIAVTDSKKNSVVVSSSSSGGSGGGSVSSAPAPVAETPSSSGANEDKGNGNDDKPYSTEGNLRDRGYSSSKDGGTGAQNAFNSRNSSNSNSGYSSSGIGAAGAQNAFKSTDDLIHEREKIYNQLNLGTYQPGQEGALKKQYDSLDAQIKSRQAKMK